MKIILIQFKFSNPGKPYSRGHEGKNLNYMFPLGLPYISAILKQAGHDVTCLNLNHRAGTAYDVVFTEMFAKGYDVAFVGGLSLFYPHIRDLIESVRIASPTTKVICGGGIITAQPEIMMEMLKPDYCILGEGETSALRTVDFLDGGDKVDIDRFVSSATILDLDALPFPDYESFNFSEYVDNIRPTDYFAFDVVDSPRVYPIVASRSCPYNCTFCFHPLGKKYRQRSIDNIMAELKERVPKYNINIVTIYDEMFSNSFERMKEFCEKFKALSDTLPYKLWFVCNIRVDKVTDEMLKIMKESGACTISFGLESYSQTVLDSMQKHITTEQIYNAAVLTRKNHLGFQGNFIFGDPVETLDTAEETLEFVHRKRNLLGTAVALDFVVPFPGSPLYKRCVTTGIIPDEIKLIEEREAMGYPKEPMNMTSLSDSDFEVLRERVFNEKLSAPYSHMNNQMKVVCPSCGSVSSIPKNFVPRFRSRNFGCRTCNYRFDVASYWYPYVVSILSMLGRKNTQRIEELKARLT